MKPRKASKPPQPAPASSTEPSGSTSSTDSGHNFAKLGNEFLQASKFIHEGFKNTPKWPTYQTAFQALENYLKAYLLNKGATLEQVRDIGPKLRGCPGRLRNTHFGSLARGNRLQGEDAGDDSLIDGSDPLAGFA